jgi:hypothetical protein
MTHAVRETLDAALADRARRQKGIGDRKHDQVNALFATRRGTLSPYDVLPRPPSGRGPRRRSISSARARRGDRALVGTLALLVISILAMDSARGTQAWRTQCAVSPNDRRRFHELSGQWLLGLDARSRGDTNAALGWMGHAFALYSRDRQLVVDYSETLMQHGQPREAQRVGCPGRDSNSQDPKVGGF